MRLLHSQHYKYDWMHKKHSSINSGCCLLQPMVGWPLYYDNNIATFDKRNHNNRKFTSNRIYYEDETNICMSQKEQERIKSEITSHSGGGTDEYELLLNELDEQVKLMNALMDKEEENSEGEDSLQLIIKEMQNVAVLQWNLGMLEEAKSLQEDILRRQILYYNADNTANNPQTNVGGLPQHLDIATTLHIIGSIQSRLKETEDAKKWFDASLTMKRILLCDELGYEHHYELGKTYNGLAIVGLQTLDDEEGDVNSVSIMDIIKLFELAENHFVYHGERTGGEIKCNKDNDDNLSNSNAELEDGYVGDSMADHPHVASINENIAMLYRKHGDFSMALQKYKEALRIRMLWTPTQQIESLGDSTIVNLKMDIGDCFKALQKYEDGLEEYEDALRLHLLVIRPLRKKQLEEQQNEHDKNPLVSPLESILRHNIGQMHANLERYDQAMEEYQTSLKIKKEIEIMSPEVALTLNAIGALKGSMSQYDSALAYFNEALYVLTTYSSMFGKDTEIDERIAQTKKNISLIEKQPSSSFKGGFIQ